MIKFFTDTGASGAESQIYYTESYLLGHKTVVLIFIYILFTGIT